MDIVLIMLLYNKFEFQSQGLYLASLRVVSNVSILLLNVLIKIVWDVTAEIIINMETPS